MDLRIFTEPQQGASYQQLLAVARQAEASGFDGFFRSDHYLQHGRRRRAARAHRHLGHARGHRPRDHHHPPRHAGVLGHVPPARAAGRGRGPGRRDERRPGRARHRGRLVRRRAPGLRHPLPAHWASASTCWREQLEIITGLWRTPPDSQYSFEGRPLHAGRLAGAAQGPSSPADHRSSSAGTGPSGPRAWPPATPASSTCPSPRSSAFVDQRGQGGARPARPSTAIPTTWSTRWRWWCAAGDTDAEVERRAAAIGREPGRRPPPERGHRFAGRGARDPGHLRRGGRRSASTCRSSTSTTSTTSP